MLSRSVHARLILILAVTAALWAGVCGIRLNSDDYQYIPSLAPIAHFGDVLRPFVQPDANPSYFRPVANVTMALDFLLFGWSGAAFHITNLLFHLIATLLVFYVARDVFRLRENEALFSALIFGLIASHECNLVVDTDRADTLATIFVMLTLLYYVRRLPVLALISFALALLSKEIAILALPVLGIVECNTLVRTKWDWSGSMRRVAPFLMLSVAYFFYHAHFTQSIASSQPLQAAGAHSLSAFFRNGAYSIGYLVLPLDLSQAETILSNYRAIALVLGGVLIALAIWGYVQGRNKESFRTFLLPLSFTVLTGSILFLSFERWRLYPPSVGAIAIIVLFVNRTLNRRIRIIVLFLCISLGGFHIYRALAAESAWRESTALRDQLKNDLTQILTNIRERPAVLGILASPAKLGSASVIQLGEGALVTRAEADRISAYNRATGSERGVKVDSWTAVDVYALDRSRGFESLTVDSIAFDKYLVSVPKVSSIVLYPSAEEDRLDLVFHPGDSIRAPEYTDIIRSTSTGMAKSIEVDVHDSAAILLAFDSSTAFRRIR